MIRQLFRNFNSRLVILLVCLGPISLAQTNRYLEELGKSFNASSISNWSKENDGIQLSDSQNERYFGVALPQYGVIYDYDFNKVNKITTVTGITFGKATTLKAIVSLKDEDKFRDARQDLPFGLKIGMSRAEVEAKTGKLQTIKHSQREGVQQVYFSNLPGFRFMNLTMWFEQEALSLFIIKTNRNGANAYQRRIEDTKHPMRLDIKSAIAEKSKTNRKLPYNSFFDGLSFIFYDEELARKERENPEVMRVSLSYELGADSVAILPENGYRAVWCTEDIVDKESFFDELSFYMNMALDSGFMNHGYPDKFVQDYHVHQSNPFEVYYRDKDDGYDYLTRSDKPVLHLYSVKQSNEVVLDIYESSSERRLPDRPGYVGVCTPEDPDLALKDQDYFEKYNIDIEALKQRYGQEKGNGALQVLGGRGSLSAAGFEITNGYNEETTESWLKRIEFKLDKEYSRSVFQEALPFGFKKGMKLSQIKMIIPDFEYEKRHAKEDWFTTYSWIRISPNVQFSITMSFRRGKLARLVVELGEEEANSREWQMLKNRILPELN